MAKIEFTFKEIIEICKPFLPEEVTNLNSGNGDIKFTYIADIFSFKKDIPFLLTYSEYSKSSISFDYSILLKPFEQKVIGQYLGVLDEKTKGVVKIADGKVIISIEKVKNLNIYFERIEKIENGLLIEFGVNQPGA
jgi:hypothetical protein